MITLDLPSNRFDATIKIRLRTPGHLPLKSVLLDGKAWTEFNAQEETVTIPPGVSGSVSMVAEY
jgi:hypothetical protein